jgi:hypothetical protein
MVESFKFKSKLANIVVFLAGLIVYVGKDGLYSIMPSEYANLVPVIVLVAGYFVVQGTENTRVAVAEQLVRENIRIDDSPLCNDEYECDEI